MEAKIKGDLHLLLSEGASHEAPFCLNAFRLSRVKILLGTAKIHHILYIRTFSDSF